MARPHPRERGQEKVMIAMRFLTNRGKGGSSLQKKKASKKDSCPPPPKHAS